jgi:hydrogenase expression/formation protein HypE
LYVVDERKLVAIASVDIADWLVDRMRKTRYGKDACIIGEVKPEPRGIVAMRRFWWYTHLRYAGWEQLPRIC